MHFLRLGSIPVVPVVLNVETIGLVLRVRPAWGSGGSLSVRGLLPTCINAEFTPERRVYIRRFRVFTR